MKLETAFEEGALKLRLAGELDHHAAKKIVAEIEGVIDVFLPRRCVVDMGGVTFMDSSGIALLVKTMRMAGDIGCAAEVCNVRPQPRRVLRAAGADKLVGILPQGEGA